MPQPRVLAPVVSEGEAVVTAGRSLLHRYEVAIWDAEAGDRGVDRRGRRIPGAPCDGFVEVNKVMRDWLGTVSVGG